MSGQEVQALATCGAFCWKRGRGCGASLCCAAGDGGRRLDAGPLGVGSACWDGPQAFGYINRGTNSFACIEFYTTVATVVLWVGY
jgi:hypothetical protein